MRVRLREGGRGAEAAGRPADQVEGVRRGEFIMLERQNTADFFLFFCMSFPKRKKDVTPRNMLR